MYPNKYPNNPISATTFSLLSLNLNFWSFLIEVKANLCGSSRPEVLCENDVIKHLAIATGKPPVLVSQVFSCECCKIYKISFFYRTTPGAAFVFCKEPENK